MGSVQQVGRHYLLRLVSSYLIARRRCLFLCRHLIFSLLPNFAWSTTSLQLDPSAPLASSNNNNNAASPTVTTDERRVNEAKGWIIIMLSWLRLANQSWDTSTCSDSDLRASDISDLDSKWRPLATCIPEGNLSRAPVAPSSAWEPITALANWIQYHSDKLE